MENKEGDKKKKEIGQFPKEKKKEEKGIGKFSGIKIDIFFFPPEWIEFEHFSNADSSFSKIEIPGAQSIIFFFLNF